MKRADKVVSSIYRKIAIDIACDIARGKYVEGQKLFGRSVLSSQYNVSPETIRKAVFLLKDVGILDTEKGSGVEILSAAKATEFVERYNETQNIGAVRNDIVDWAQRQMEETAKIIEKIQFIADAAERIRAYNPLTPFELRITSTCSLVGTTIEETNFWHTTGATVIAIKRGDNLILSPGPYASFLENDIIYIIGTEEAYAIAKRFIEETSESGS